MIPETVRMFAIAENRYWPLITGFCPSRKRNHLGSGACRIMLTTLSALKVVTKKIEPRLETDVLGASEVQEIKNVV